MKDGSISNPYCSTSFEFKALLVFALTFASIAWTVTKYSMQAPSQATEGAGISPRRRKRPGNPRLNVPWHDDWHESKRLHRRHGRSRDDRGRVGKADGSALFVFTTPPLMHPSLTLARHSRRRGRQGSRGVQLFAPTEAHRSLMTRKEAILALGEGVGRSWSLRLAIRGAR